MVQLTKRGQRSCHGTYPPPAALLTRYFGSLRRFNSYPLGIAGSPFRSSRRWSSKSSAAYTALAVLLSLLSTYIIFFYDSNVISGILIVCNLLLLFEWVVKWGYSSGSVILGSFLAGACLFAMGMAFERWGSLLALTTAAQS